VAIIDDHVVLNEMLAQAVGVIDGYDSVGWAANASDALALCRREQPDIIVLDLVLPKVSGLSLLNELREICPKARFVIFSGNLTSTAIRSVLAAGVHAIVGKGSPLGEFRDALHAVTAGQTYFGAQVREMIKDIISHPDGAAAEVSQLTPRERTVLRYIAEGLSSKEIAAKLGVSINTVVNHRSNLMKKTGLHRVAQLSLYAAQIGLIGETG
jgi:DNA-binding NarL/FixJ family response regulator